MNLLDTIRHPVRRLHWRLYTLTLDGNVKLTSAMRFFKEIPDDVIDCIVLDPPAKYGCPTHHIERDVDDDSRQEDMSTTVSDMCKALTPIAEQCARVLKPGGTTIFLSTPHMASAWEFAAADAGLRLQNEIVVLWKYARDRRRPANEYPSLASVVRWHSKPGYRFAPSHDIVLKSNVITVEQVPDGIRGNFSQRPVSLFTYLISSLTRPKDLVIDPFCGSGSALVAAIIAGRKCAGCEIDSTQVALARHRVATYAALEELEGRQKVCWWLNGNEIEVEG